MVEGCSGLSPPDAASHTHREVALLDRVDKFGRAFLVDLSGVAHLFFADIQEYRRVLL
jgi:hypothetical protein